MIKKIIAIVALLFFLLLLDRAKARAIDASQYTDTGSHLDSSYYDEIEKLIVEIKSDWAGEIDPRVYAAMRNVPRHLFVDKAQRRQAYMNRPLPIGYGQTISQPLIVALMTDLLKLKPNDKVLEIGSGSGYQAFILADIVREVHTIEIIPALGKRVQEKTTLLSKGNITTYIQDGYLGLSSQAPFDAIIVTAAASHIPPSLLKQLKVKGRMVIPVGGVYQVQNLLLIEKRAENDFSISNILPVRFVEFKGRINEQKNP
jgi:protein-L-isoaspartate(D-aspartate) O-methyltransferase